jgi:hypothetical protein
MKVSDIFAGMKFGIPQNVANMTVIPIISDNEISGVSGEMIFQIANDTDYSRLTLENVDDKPVIVPQGTRFFTKGQGQDRAILSATVIGPEKSKELQVGCVAPSDASHIRMGSRDYGFIPARLRIPAMEKQGTTSYSVLWSDIESYLKKTGVPGNRLQSFYDNFNKELEEFVAQFEPVEKQIGAVILINNEVAGIEIYPNYLAWSNIWRVLIRDSYGADAIGLIREKKMAAYRPIIDLDNVASFEDLTAEITRIKGHFVDYIQGKLEPMLEQSLEKDAKETSLSFKTWNLTGENFIGQMITKNDEAVYVSLLRANGNPRVLPDDEVEEDEDW